VLPRGNIPPIGDPISSLVGASQVAVVRVWRGQVTTHECDRAPAMTLDSFHAAPSSTRVHALGAGRVEPHPRDGGRPAGRFDSLDQVDDMPRATGLGNDEHTRELRGQIGPFVQIVDHETCGSDWFAVNHQNKALGRPRWRYRCSDLIMCLFECVAILMPPLVPEPAGNNRQQIRPIRYPDNQFLLHCSVLFGSACTALLHPVCHHNRPTYGNSPAAIRRVIATGVRSNVVLGSADP
jgi:hypothetical protein